MPASATEPMRAPRAMSTTTAATEAKNRMPVPSRIVVGCHSVTRLVTSAFVDNPMAYAHTAGPNGVRQAAITLTRAIRAGSCRRSAPIGGVLQPGETEDDGSQEEAAVQVGPQDHEDRDGPQAGRVTMAIRNEHERDREQRHPEELRAQGECRRRHHECAEREQRGVPHRPAMPIRDDEQTAEDHADERGAKERQTRPARQTKDRRQDDLRSPLLVDPWQAIGRERPCVDAGDGSARKDLVAGAEVVREIDGREAREQRGEHGKCDREEHPESAQ